MMEAETKRQLVASPRQENAGLDDAAVLDSRSYAMTREERHQEMVETEYLLLRARVRCLMGKCNDPGDQQDV
jgi:hypothetical protein